MSKCKQCGQPKGNTMWKICGKCKEKNIAYDNECLLMARALRYEFSVNPPAAKRKGASK